MDRKTVILAEDHQLIRTGLRALVESFDSFEVVAEAGNAEQAVALVCEHQPALVLLDVTLPDASGIATLPRLKKASPHSRVLVLSMYETDDVVLAAMQAGADGYLPKSSAADELAFALDALVRGRIYLSPTISHAVLGHALAAQGAPAPAAQPPAAPDARDEPPPSTLLTTRQLEILRLVASGRSMKEIAYDLELSVKTVETHRAQIMERLGIRDLPRLVLYAVRHGLVSTDRA